MNPKSTICPRCLGERQIVWHGSMATCPDCAVIPAVQPESDEQNIQRDLRKKDTGNLPTPLPESELPLRLKGPKWKATPPQSEIERGGEPHFPKYPRTRAECINESSETTDGTYIAGHVFGEVVAFQDEKTSRWYMVDVCMDCGTPEVLFVEAHSDFVNEAKQYPVVKIIGGSRE